MEEHTNDTWSDLQAFKSRQHSLREKLQRRKKEREDIVQSLCGGINDSTVITTNTSVQSANESESEAEVESVTVKQAQIEKQLLRCLCDAALKLPIDSRALCAGIRRTLHLTKSEHERVMSLLHKFAHQGLIELGEESLTADGHSCLVVATADHSKLITFAQDVYTENLDDADQIPQAPQLMLLNDHQKRNSEELIESKCKQLKCENEEDCTVNLESLLSLESTREKENKRMGEELLDLLSKPTAKERSLVERFRSVGGGQVQEFCAHGTKQECVRQSATSESCGRLHFSKIIAKHTDESLGDCSFLNTCFHMDSCKYVHYRVDYSSVKKHPQLASRKEVLTTQRFKSILYPPQWLQCDLRFFDMTILGKFAVVMADPPWDIHMELPYGTLGDDEMRKLNIPSLQDDGLIFLWVTGRAMELGRECLKLWGYERCDEIIWVKTNQLQRIIRTGRTGHWLNHGKEHCLVGIKGKPKHINRGLDCDVIVAEVRATSHKPDEIYGIIERLSPGTRKIELFGRPHNVQPNWITLGNQLDGVRLLDPELIEAFKNRYQDGNCMAKTS